MKTSLALCLTLVMFLSSDWIIQSTGALKCFQGVKCWGKDCKQQLIQYGSVDCTDGMDTCQKLTATYKDKEKSYSDYSCTKKGGCNEAKKLFEAATKEKEDYKDFDKGATKCDQCGKNDCNSAPKSAHGLGLFMMTAAVVASLVILVM